MLMCSGGKDKLTLFSTALGNTVHLGEGCIGDSISVMCSVTGPGTLL